MIREIKNNTLEIRQDEIQDFTEDDVKTVCNRLLKIMSDASNFEITFDKEHDAPNCENSCIGDFEEINKFNEEISGCALFFPNTKFIYKNDDREVSSLYLIKANDKAYLIIDSLKTYDFKQGDAKHLNHRLYGEEVKDSLFYSRDENKVINYYFKTIIDYSDYLVLLNNIKHLTKKNGTEFSNWSKSFKTEFRNYEYAVYFKINNYILSNEAASVDISFYDKCITLYSKELNGDFSQANIYKCFEEEIERKKTEYIHQIAHAKNAIQNVRNLVNKYNNTQEQISNLQKTLNNDLRYILK